MRSIRAVLYGRRQLVHTANILVPQFVLIEAQDSVGQRYLWKLNLASFEAVHGISRVVKLILNDKVTTAITINLEDLSNPKDNGGFLICLVTKLLSFYLDIVRNQQDLNHLSKQCDGLDCVTLYEEGHFVLGAGSTDSFCSSLTRLHSDLLQFKRHLDLRTWRRVPAAELFAQAELLFLSSVDILHVCCLYMDLVHPSWIQLQRDNRLCFENLEALQKKLLDRFVQLRSICASIIVLD